MKAKRESEKTKASGAKGVKPALGESKKKEPALSRPEKEEIIVTLPEGRYLGTVGRRKTSVARVRFYLPREGEMERVEKAGRLDVHINKKPLESHFPTQELRSIVTEPFDRSGFSPNFSVWVKVRGGGIHSQAEAVRHGISRALEKYNPELRKILKPLGFLKRDPRMKERRKFGLKKARRAPQWSKR